MGKKAVEAFSDAVGKSLGLVSGGRNSRVSGWFGAAIAAEWTGAPIAVSAGAEGDSPSRVLLAALKNTKYCSPFIPAFL